MTRPPDNMMPALERFRRGDIAGARAAVAQALAGDPNSIPLHGLAGLLAGREGDHGGALPHFRALRRLAPDDKANRSNLASALIATGQTQEAASLCAEDADDLRLVRLAAYLAQEGDRPGEAAAAYRRVVAAQPDDFESWNNLANALAAIGDLPAAVDAGVRAVNLRPDLLPIAKNLSGILGRAGHDKDRQRLMRDAAARAPGDADMLLELGLAEAGARDYPAAEAAFREAIAASGATFTSAWLELGLLFENLNRLDDLAALLDAADAAGVDVPEMGFLRAWLLRRRGRTAEALPLAEATPETINPIRRHQLIAELNDRADHPDRAFPAFVKMNEEAVAAKPAPGGPSYRELVEADLAVTTPAWTESWTPLAPPAAPPPPLFLVGFPRSGTTLLDTLLMNVPDMHVLEELPVLAAVDRQLGGTARLAGLDQAELERLHAAYLTELAALSPPPSGATVVDKHPLHMAKMPLIHRLFPRAKILFVERHPCDAVLSCFIANFQLNIAMRSFTTLEETARTYDAVFSMWERARTLLPLDVHFVRYERMVADLEGEMRPLLAFLGRDFDPAVLDNQGSAARRDPARTASYSQVTEPIYRRAAGRWERYRDYLEPVMPILRPWIERLGYDA